MTSRLLWCLVTGFLLEFKLSWPDLPRHQNHIPLTPGGSGLLFASDGYLGVEATYEPMGKRNISGARVGRWWCKMKPSGSSRKVKCEIEPKVQQKVQQKNPARTQRSL